MKFDHLLGYVNRGKHFQLVSKRPFYDFNKIATCYLLIFRSFFAFAWNAKSFSNARVFGWNAKSFFISDQYQSNFIRHTKKSLRK